MKILLNLLVGTLYLMACSSDTLVTNRYAKYPAYLIYPIVNAHPPLYHALTNPGQWCTITLDATGQKFRFNNPSENTIGESNTSTLIQYRGYKLGLSGIIVGLPNIPEPGTMAPIVTCYDLACPNCYEQYSITLPLILNTQGIAHCKRCNRHYDLNSQGQIQLGNKGISLYRYRINYTNNTLHINN